jgi:hypothetical protein
MKYLITFLLILSTYLGFSQDEYLWKTQDSLRISHPRMDSTSNPDIDTIFWQLGSRHISANFMYRPDSDGVNRCYEYTFTYKLKDSVDDLIPILEDTLNYHLDIYINASSTKWLPDGSQVLWMKGYLVDTLEIEGRFVGFILTRAFYKRRGAWFISEQGSII